MFVQDFLLDARSFLLIVMIYLIPFLGTTLVISPFLVIYFVPYGGHAFGACGFVTEVVLINRLDSHIDILVVVCDYLQKGPAPLWKKNVCLCGC